MKADAFQQDTIMELQDTTASIPLAMAYSVKIEPEGHRTVPLECSSQLEDQMDIRVNAGFYHRNPNVYIPPSCINNPGNKFHPNSSHLLYLTLVKWIIYILVEILLSFLQISQQ